MTKINSQIQGGWEMQTNLPRLVLQGGLVFVATEYKREKLHNQERFG